MKQYLDENPNCFVGYIGQTDAKDNITQRYKLVSQRSDVYNLLTNSIFCAPDYKLSSRTIFQEVNLRLIRKSTKAEDDKITPLQENNYSKFLAFFERNKELHHELMTEATKRKYYNL